MSIQLMYIHELMDHEEDAAVLLLIHAMISRSESQKYSADKPL